MDIWFFLCGDVSDRLIEILIDELVIIIALLFWYFEHIIFLLFYWTQILLIFNFRWKKKWDVLLWLSYYLITKRLFDRFDFINDILIWSITFWILIKLILICFFGFLVFILITFQVDLRLSVYNITFNLKFFFLWRNYLYLNSIEVLGHMNRKSFFVLIR